MATSHSSPPVFMPSDERRSPGRPAYAQPLRAIGQAIEAQQWQDYEVFMDGSDYTIRVEAERPPSSEKRRWPLSAASHEEAPGCQIWVLRCTPEVVERLQREGRARRRDPEGLPDPYSPSQVLHVAGAYLERRGARLVRIAKRGLRVFIQFETSVGQEITEEYPLSQLYDLWVRMYLRRAKKN